MTGELRRTVSLGFCLSCAAVLCWAAVSRAAEPAVYVWVEAEQPAYANAKFEVEAMGRAQLLSGGKWLRRSLDKNAARSAVPKEGFLLRYGFGVPQAGEYEVWARVGFEWVRAPLEWRINNAPWREVSSSEQTTNVMQLAPWVEVAWLKLGTANLRAGPATLEIRYRKPGPDGRMLMALDCFALTLGKFVPEGRLKPGEQYNSPADRKAAQNVFSLPPAKDGNRCKVTLNGLWQVARYDDPDMDVDTYTPVQRIPSPDEYPLRWMAIDVPMSLWNKPETVFAHRVIYRTRINIPASHKGRGFYLHFSGTNWIVSVFVNGKLAGAHRGVWVPWDLDVSQFIEPGKINELAVAIKGPYYAIDVENYGKEKDLDRHRNRPRARLDWVFWVAPIYPSTKGDGNGVDYGIVNPVTLVSAGDVYTEDVFVKTFVEDKRLEAELTLRNTTEKARKVEVVCDAVYEKSGETEKRFGPAQVALAPGEAKTIVVGGKWENPKLWWPRPNPDLYYLRTTISEAGKTLDVHEQLFGFREVKIKGTGIYINGVRRNFWCWVNVHGRPYSAEEWLRQFYEDKNRFMRFSANRKTSNFLRTREERLEFYDRHGIPGRLCSMIDGMYISRVLGKRTKDPKTGKPVLIPNKPVWEGFKRHLVQLAHAYRNHPSVIFYQAENELVYITGMNIYGAYLDQIEQLMSEAIEAARKVDPTRPYTVGGAGDLSGRLEINCPHYPAGSLDYYPENAYTLEHYSTKISRWPWKRNKPWVVGESAHANWLRYGSYVLGDEVFRGPDYAKRGKARYLRMLYGGYRWAGVAGFFPWDNLHQYEDAQKIFSDLCVIPRKQTHRLFAGRKNELLFKVMNDTLSSSPVVFEWKYEIAGKKIAGERKTLNIEPGFGVEQTLTIPAPDTDKRLDGLLTLRVSQEGAEEYVDVRAIPVLPRVRKLNIRGPVLVYDKSGRLAQFFRQANVAARKLNSLSECNAASGLLVIGPDTLSAKEAFGQEILAFAARGGRVLALEQEVPIAGANLPAPLQTSTHFGGYAHPKALGTPIFKDLGEDDLIDWAGDHPTYKNAYKKPLQGGRALAECGEMLDYSPLIEMPCGKGVIVLCQLRVGAKLGVDPAAEVLLRNLVQVYANYRPATGVIAVYSPDDALLAEKVRQTGLLSEKVSTLVAALDISRYRVVVVHASEENLRQLNAARQKAQAFAEAGGWIMLCGVDRRSIGEFNRFVRANHLLRPFRLERVTLERPDYYLAATLGNRDLAMYSTEWIARWKGLRWISGNVYTFVVDGRDIAPFCQMPGGPKDIFAYKPTRDDKDPYNFVNGMFNSDFWRYIRQIWVPEQGAQPLVFTLPRAETIAEIRIWNNANYWTIKDLDIIFDGNAHEAVHTVLPDGEELKVVKLEPPRKVAKTITLQIKSWRERRLDRPDVRLVGIDNVRFIRAQAPRGAVFIDNVGGLVAYPRGKGGVFLNQLKFMAHEPNPENAQKKLRILGTILQNMGAGSRATAVAVPGVNVRYEPIDIMHYCTQFLAERAGKPGWFGRKGEDLRNFPVGERTWANVLYHTVDYATAPVPDCIMLAGRGAPAGLPKAVEGIKVGRKADMLFFLHAANVTRPTTDNERSRIGAREKPFVLPEVARYVIHYADGKTAVIPVILEKHVDHWLQSDPRPLEGAQIAWTGDVPAAPGKKAVLYSMQAQNPRPETTITAIDFLPGVDEKGKPTNRAVPVLLAITLGTLIK